MSVKRIHQLPPALANQIAAGEVIERPASVVKELLENTLDAEASSVTIEVGYGGLNCIKISDNGLGILAEDLPLAIAAHATSKIAQLEDLYAIDSMGFRGEALASIASIAKVKITSKPASQAHAMQLSMVDGQLQLRSCARANGTTVEVLDIFYNAPVRKRFLKSERLEFQAIETVVKRFALSAETMEIILKHNGKLVFHLPAALTEKALLQRISKLFGTGFSREAKTLDFERQGMRLQGWLSGPGGARSQNDRLWVYLNQRMVRDKLIHHAIKQAYDGLLHPGRFPACLLYLTIATKEVDVNVHPTKHEVRFQQPRLVHDFLLAGLSLALETYKSSDSITVRQPSLDAKAYTVPPLVMKGEQAVTWTTLNAHYALLWVEQLPYVVDILALHRDYLYHQLSQAQKPLAERRLLLPLRFTAQGGMKDWLPLLKQVGLVLREQGEEFFLETIPQLLPQTNCRALFAALAQEKTQQEQILFQLLSHHQSIDLTQLSFAEKDQLHGWFCKKLAEGSLSFGKLLQAEGCQSYVYG